MPQYRSVSPADSGKMLPRRAFTYHVHVQRFCSSVHLFSCSHSSICLSFIHFVLHVPCLMYHHVHFVPTMFSLQPLTIDIESTVFIKIPPPPPPPPPPHAYHHHYSPPCSFCSPCSFTIFTTTMFMFSCSCSFIAISRQHTALCKQI